MSSFVWSCPVTPSLRRSGAEDIGMLAGIAACIAVLTAFHGA
jgi:hypothetical protein